LLRKEVGSIVANLKDNLMDKYGSKTFLLETELMINHGEML
jgi:hypothetical protein